MLLYHHSQLFFAIDVVDMMFAASLEYNESASCRADTEQKKKYYCDKSCWQFVIKTNFPEWNMLLMIALT
jgi:hypothetical protein